MKPIIDYLRQLCCVVAVFASATANASILSAYNLGLSYSTTTNYAVITYDTPATKTTPSDCDTSSPAPAGQMQCSAYLAPDGGGSPSVSAYIEKPFQRQGFFYFQPGLTFSTLSYTGGLATQPTSPVNKSSTTRKPSANGASTATAPLDRAYIQMYGLNWKGYLRFGITPHYFPDLLASAGIGVQTVAGNVHVFTTKTNAYIIQPDAFGELEAVLLRWHTGYLSIFGTKSQTLATPIGTNLIHDNPSGTNTTNYRLSLSNEELGLRLLFPF